MYLDFYKLKEQPFNLTPDSHFLFRSEKHKEALVHLIYGLRERKGFILITGEIGAGKTTLCRALIKDLGRYFKVALIFNPMVSPCGLLRAIVNDLDIPCKNRTKQGLIEALNKHLLEGEEVIVIIDEAQDLSPSALEQVRLLGNLETEKKKLLQLVLVGQPELKDLLAKEKLKQLNQRIAVRYHIQPLNRAETSEYIYYRLNIAGAEGKIWFPPDALAEIYINSSGIPRIINIICDYCLMVGYTNESWMINKEMVNQAIREWQGINSSATMATV